MCVYVFVLFDMNQGLNDSCRTLRHISLLGESRITDRALKHLAVNNRKLNTFKIEGKLALAAKTVARRIRCL